MAAQGALARSSPSSSTADAAEFRAGQTAARRERDGVSAGNVAFPSSSESDDSNSGDELHREQNADRFANGIGSPIASLYSSLGNEDEEEEPEAANSDFSEESERGSGADRDAMDNYLALQSQAETNQTEADRTRLRLRSLLRQLKEKERGKGFDQALEEIKKMFARRSTDLISKGASIIDEGEFVEILDSIGVAVSTYQVVITIFEDSIPDKVKKQMRVPPADIPTKAMTIMQYMKWFLMVFVLIPFCISFQITAFVAFCDWYAPCNLLWSGILGI
ncbi:MAG: hypothetical protein NUV56_03560 [Candidatus Uhrbacteria bacterium]|nr:hypothetical protein [Candidatus Uhrbacteria bacterium]